MFRYCLLSVIMLPLFVTGQQVPEKLTHWMTPGEMLRRDQIGITFTETDPPIAPVRNIAEFDQVQGALVRYPFGIPIELIKRMSENLMVTTIVASSSQQATVLNQYTSGGVNTANCNFLIAPSDSYWTRDYGPWFAADSSNTIGVVDFPYNRPRPNDDEIPVKVAQMLGIPLYGMNVIHTGGNYMTDGYGQSASTQLVVEENPTQTQAQIEQKVHDYLGIETYHIRPDPNNTYIDHIDCWAKFLGVGKILVRSVPTTHPQYSAIEAAAAYWTTQLSPFGTPYQVYRVYTPDDQPYTNSVILNNRVYVPIMNSQWDDDALAVYEQAMPGYEVIGMLNTTGNPWESTDALHCRVMGIADLDALFIRHIPISGTQPAEQNYLVNADLIPYSKMSVYPDSVFVIYKVNGGSFDTLTMMHTTGITYTASIPHQDGGSTVSYYIYAADMSGNRAKAPRMGTLDPYTFTTTWTDLMASPDTLWFNTFDECINGKYATVKNNTANPHDIVDAAQYGYDGGFYWYVDPWPIASFPQQVNAGDSVNFLVHIGIPVDAPLTDYLFDTLTVVSDLNPHHVIIAVNADLVQGTNDITGQNIAWISNYPNPFTGQTSIAYFLPEKDAVEIRVLDLDGKDVMNFESRMEEKGNHSFTWNGEDRSGKPVNNGIYFLQLKSEKGIITRKIVKTE